jgi:hypothetical protein
MKWRRTCLLAALFFAFLALHPLVHADTIVRGFQAGGSLEPGLIVSLSKNAKNTVEATPGNQPSRIYGVVIDPTQAPVTVQSAGKQVFIATAGNYSVLVSDQNGVVKIGDYLSISAVSGIGAKVTPDQSLVLGRAITAFDGSSGVITKTSDGHSIGRITVSVSPGKNPLAEDPVNVPGPLKKISQSIAGRNVAAIRIWAASGIFIVAAIIGVSVLISGIRSSITAIGRNPLSKKTIMRGLWQVVGLAVMVFTIGLIGVYLLLKA